ncbi:MAG: VPLPA-CTERM sorting domain-containing protein [Pseudomonadota bacterium]
MKTIFGAIVGLSIAATAGPANALAMYTSTGELFLQLLEGSGPDIEISVEAVVDQVTSTTSTTGSGTTSGGFSIMDDGFGPFGVEGFVTGDTSLPGGTSVNDLNLNVIFTLTHADPTPGAGIEQDYIGDFIIDLSALATSTLVDETADSLVSVGVVGGTGQPPPAFQTVFADHEFQNEDSTTNPLFPNDPIIGGQELLFSTFGSLMPGDTVTYEFQFDIRGAAATPPGPGAEIPLPATGALMLLGVGSFIAARRRRGA